MSGMLVAAVVLTRVEVPGFLTRQTAAPVRARAAPELIT